MSKQIQILIPVSVGEILDRITILELKRKYIIDDQRLTDLHDNLRQLQQIVASEVAWTSQLDELREDLRKVNDNLWRLEDEIRLHEKCQNFSEDFIRVARSIIQQNDKRAWLKAEINRIAGSINPDIKQYR